MADLRISDDLSLPVDVITQTIGVFARKGAGKTYTAKRIVEEVVRARLPVVVIDPLGAWWGLRSSADGKSPGLPVVILGGEHGDVPLEATAGALIADVVIEHPGAYILDLSDFGSDAEQDRFATAFAQRLYRGKARRRDPLLLVVDEADAFAPLQGVKGQETMIGAFRTIATRARLRGIGSLWITQRPAVLNASIRAMIELLIVLQVTGKLDHDAIVAWLRNKGTAEQLDAVDTSISKLDVGELWAVSPAWLRLFVRTKASPTSTFDSSRTPEVGEERIEPEAFAAIDLASLDERMKATAEQAKANDPTELRKRIRELEAAGGTARVETVERIVEVPVLNGQVEHLQAVAVTLGQVGHELSRIGADIVNAIARVSVPRPGPEQPASSGGAPARGQIGAPRSGMPVEVLEAEASRVDPAQAGGVGAPSPKPRAAAGPSSIDPLILSALVDAPNGRPFRQVALLTGYSPAGGFFRRSMSSLRERGLVEGIDPARLTDDGRRVATEEGRLPIQLGRSLLDSWIASPRTGGAGVEFLQAIADAYPDVLTPARLGELTGKSPAGGYFRRSLKKLRDLGLVSGIQEIQIASELVADRARA